MEVIVVEILDFEKTMRQPDSFRKQVICKFAGISIDMNYMLCIPSVHAKYQSEEMVVDFCGGTREISDYFPEDKAALVVKWVNLHKDEIQDNHRRINSMNEPPLMIEPLQS